MTMFDDRFGAVWPNMKKPMGLSLASPPPITPGALAIPPVRTDMYPSPGGPATDPTAPPFRLDPSAAPPPGLQGTLPPGLASKDVLPPGLANRGLTPPSPFPVNGAPAVPNTIPNVNAGPGGLTLNSTPAAPGWAGTVGVPSPGAAPAANPEMDKTLDALGEMAKGINPKPIADPMATTITPMTAQPNQPNSLSFDLMAQLLNRRRGFMGR